MDGTSRLAVGVGLVLYFLSGHQTAADDVGEVVSWQPVHEESRIYEGLMREDGEPHLVQYARSSGWDRDRAFVHREEDLRLARQPSGGSHTVKCESRGDRYTYCRTNMRGRVRLDRQLSNAPCRQYSTWGADGDGSGIWVRNGCRGIFVVEGYDHTYPDNWWGWGRTVTCKSNRFRYNHCTLDRRGRRVRLERRLSDAPCTRGSTWGVDREGIWVDRGCAAVFAVD